jgi:hypothetical protein
MELSRVPPHNSQQLNVSRDRVLRSLRRKKSSGAVGLARQGCAQWR